MAISNSYVKLPEGTMGIMVFLSQELWTLDEPPKV